MAATDSTNSIPNSTNAPTLTCAQCGGDNTLTSRFCQHCGAPLLAASASDGTTPAPTAAPAPVAAPTPTPAAAPNPTDAIAALGGALPPIGVALPPITSPAPNLPAPAAPPVDSGTPDVPSTPTVQPTPTVPEQTAKDIDYRRAHQLLDRALMLSERGDLSGAILACRQSVSLAPASPQGYSMWGLLLERAGETGKAIKAYEKVLELAPDSVLERESLQRLRAAAARNSLTGTFHFDEGELFDDALGPATSAATTTPPATAPVVPTVSAATGAAAASTPAPVATSVSAAPAGSTDAVPVAPVTPAPAVSSPAPLRFDDPLDTPTGGPLWWQALLRQPSYYFRGVPVMATTVLSLLFLLWARDWATTRYAPTTPPTGPTTTEVVPGEVDESGEAVNTNPTPAMDVFPKGPAPVSNNPNAATAPGTAPNPATGGATATGGGNTAAGGGTTRATGRTTTSSSGGGTTPRITSPVLPPADPRTAGSRPSTGTQPAGGGVPSIPPPRVNLNNRSNTPEAPPVAIGPGTSDGGGSTAGGGSSAAGGPLNPAANAGSGYIRIRPDTAPERVVPRSVSPASAPARSDNLADRDERIASADARAGNTGRAVERLASAASSGGSTGYRYQQRATLFLERGDYARAADEYQTAISAYEDQIRRGDDLAQARSGLRSARSGLRVALAGLRR